MWTRCRSRRGVCTYRWTISDTGIGMSEEFLAHIFAPFSQERVDARSVRRGTGLGMTIVKGLIEQMGGTISVPGQLGAGSTFVICIPFEIGEKPEAKPLNIPKVIATIARLCKKQQNPSRE